jgi:hypothetical protein
MAIRKLLDTFKGTTFQVELIEETYLETEGLGTKAIIELSLRISNLTGTCLKRWPETSNEIRSTSRTAVLETFNRMKESDFNLAEIGIKFH